MDPSLAWSRVAAFASAVDASLGKWLLESHGIGLTEYRALVHLAGAPDRELRVNDLAGRVGLNQSSVTRLVSRLESKAVAQRDVCADDARGVYAVLTDKGSALVDEVREAHEARVRELLSQAGTHFPLVDPDQLRRDVDAVAQLIAQA